jgi:hypothetical protein
MIPLIYEKQIFMVLTFDFDIRPFIRLADTTDFSVSFLIRLEDFQVPSCYYFLPKGLYLRTIWLEGQPHFLIISDKTLSQ